MNIQANVKDYYGKTLQGTEDLATDACCTLEDNPAYVRRLLADIHPEVSSRYYGCGLIAPLSLEGASVLDLGSGAGQDAYALSRLVGETGSVVGVDMTPEQLAVAREHKDWHANAMAIRNQMSTSLRATLKSSESWASKKPALMSSCRIV